MLTGIAIALAFIAGTLWEGCRRGGSVDLRARLALLQPDPDQATILVDRSPDGHTVMLTAQAPR